MKYSSIFCYFFKIFNLYIEGLILKHLNNVPIIVDEIIDLKLKENVE